MKCSPRLAPSIESVLDGAERGRRRADAARRRKTLSRVETHIVPHPKYGWLYGKRFRSQDGSWQWHPYHINKIRGLLVP